MNGAMKIFSKAKKLFGEREVTSLKDAIDFLASRRAIKKYKARHKNRRPKNNPPRKAVLIYDNILSIEAAKGKKSLWPREKFRHDFKAKKGKAAIYGLQDGSLLIKGRKRLWKNFNYP